MDFINFGVRMTIQNYKGIWLPDREEYLKQDIDVSPMFAGKPTIQFKKFARAFPEIKNWRHAIDIGANLGIWTRVMARCFDQVSCFEPNPECHEAFLKNTDGGDCKIDLYTSALGEERRDVCLNTRLRSTGFTRIDESGDYYVTQETLDSYKFEQVDFIKIDVEGWEHNVIKGAIKTINKYKPTIIIEQKPNNAELHGLKQFGARNLLQKMGMRVAAEMAGDFIMVW